MKFYNIGLFLTFCLTFFCSSTATAQKSTFSLSTRDSSIVFSLTSSLFSTQGEFESYAGSAEVDANGEVKSLSLVADISKAKVSSDAPETTIFINQLLNSLPSSKFSFRSTTIQKTSADKFTVTGEAFLGKNKAPVTVFVEINSLGKGELRISGVYSDSSSKHSSADAAPIPGLSGKVKYSLLFKKS
jgi:polyisoprenoid-binding protein YceI